MNSPHAWEGDLGDKRLHEVTNDALFKLGAMPDEFIGKTLIEKMDLYDGYTRHYNSMDVGRTFPQSEYQWLMELGDKRENKTALKEMFKEMIDAYNAEIQEVLAYQRESKQTYNSSQDIDTNSLALIMHWTEEKLNDLRAKIKKHSFMIGTLAGRKKKTGSIDDRDIDEAKSVPITQFIVDKIRTSGKLRFTKCPFHNEKTASFCIYKNNTFFCFGCHISGDVIEYIKKTQNLNFIDAVKFLINK